jgi:hypothetical protein
VRGLQSGCGVDLFSPSSEVRGVTRLSLGGEGRSSCCAVVRMGLAGGTGVFDLEVEGEGEDSFSFPFPFLFSFSFLISFFTSLSRLGKIRRGRGFSNLGGEGGSGDRVRVCGCLDNALCWIGGSNAMGLERSEVRKEEWGRAESGRISVAEADIMRNGAAQRGRCAYAEPAMDVWAVSL